MEKYMKKDIIEGIPCYTEIKKEEVESLLNQGIDCIRVSDNGTVVHMVKADFVNEEKAKTNERPFGDKFNDGWKKASEVVNDAATKVNEALSAAARSTRKAFAKGKKYDFDESGDPNSKAARLLKLLPFMDEEDIHDAVVDLINSGESLKDIPINAFFPFLSDEDCDAIFLKAVKDGNTNFNISSVAPFVDDECLSQIVDLYINGKLQDFDIDSIYPFLSSKDIKRLFQYILKEKREANTEEEEDK